MASASVWPWAGPLLRNPSVFLFDEPLSNLDCKTRSQVRGEIRDLHQRLKTTSVDVTHDQVEAMTMGSEHYNRGVARWQELNRSDHRLICMIHPTACLSQALSALARHQHD